MKKPGRKSLINAVRFAAVAAAVAASVATVTPASGSGGDGFLIPGVALSDAEFEIGAWCRYLVVDEIMGVRDSTVVTIAVTGQTRRNGVVAWWLELESGPSGGSAAERDVASALISSKIKTLAPGDSLVQYISELYIKRGNGAVEPADPADLEQLSLSNPTADSDWVLTPDETLDTPHGQFTCDHKHLVVDGRKEIDMGRVKLLKNDVDVFDVWLCDDVPIFRVVRCVIDRVRESKTVPSVPGIPNKEREESRTTIELIGSGFDAKPMIEIH